MNAVNGFAYDVAGGIESESVVGATEIVVDRLGHAHNLDSGFMKLLRH
jgi:hypothetical protein